MRFRYKKHSSNKAVLLKRNDRVAARNKYLREMQINQSSENPRHVAFFMKHG